LASKAIPEASAARSPGWRRRTYLLSSAAFVLVVVSGCGSEGDAGRDEPVDIGFQRISTAARTYTVGDFSAVGFRASKRYDIEELPKAIDAWYGFWALEGSGAKEFELRFYASHEDAVEAGTTFAEDAASEDANLDRATALWKEGHKDRRTIYDFRAAPMAKYKDYAIFGNVVLLCEGKTPAESLDHCEAIIGALEGRARQ